MKFQFQTQGALVVASGALAYWTAGGFSTFFIGAFAAFLVILELLWHWGMRWGMSAVHKRNQAFETRLTSLSYGSARTKALGELERWQVVRRSTAEPIPSGLPEGIVEVFSRYQQLRSPSGETTLRLGGTEQGFIKIGEAFDGGNVLVRLSDGALFDVGSDCETPSEAESYPSLYHWIAVNFAAPDEKEPLALLSHGRIVM